MKKQAISIDVELARIKSPEGKLSRLLFGPRRTKSEIMLVVESWDRINRLRKMAKARPNEIISSEYEGDPSDPSTPVKHVTLSEEYSSAYDEEFHRTCSIVARAFLMADAGFFDSVAKAIKAHEKIRVNWPETMRLELLKAAQGGRPVNLTRLADSVSAKLPRTDPEHVLRQLRRLAHKLKIRTGKAGRPRK